jgi:hypothetical protein
MDGASIFAQTRSAVAYPPSIAYSIAVNGLDGNTSKANHYHAVVDTETGAIRLQSVSDEDVAKPPTPHGVNVNFTFTLCIAKGGCGGRSIPVGRPESTGDLLGVPLLAPTYDFGIVAPYAARRVNVETTLPIIASVASSRKDYDVTLVGSEAIAGQAAYHLALKPLHDPLKYRLRDLWVSPTTYLPERAIIAGNFTVAGMANVPWQIDFVTLGSCWYVSREAPLSTLYLPHQKVVRDATIVFENIVANDSILGPAIEPDVTPTTLVEP